MIVIDYFVYIFQYHTISIITLRDNNPYPIKNELLNSVTSQSQVNYSSNSPFGEVLMTNKD